MRILHLFASPVWSGPAETIATLALAQRALGHDVAVAIDRLRTQVSSEEPAAARFAALGLLAEEALELSVKSSLLGMWRDARTLRRWPGDALHAHFSHDHFLARGTRARLVRSLHAPRSLRWSLPRADAFTTCVETTDRRILRVPHLLLPPLVSRDFIPGDKARLRQELGLDGEPLILMASTFQASRRHTLALEAFAHLRQRRPNAQLVLLGDGVLKAALRAQAGPGVMFAGYQRGAAFIRYLQACDQLWVLGLGNDYSARVAVQARACGAQVLAVNEGQLSRYADAIVSPDAGAIANAAESLPYRSVTLPDVAQVAAAVLALYRA
jgi:glycosyltransferase involved in cell wall biosynthesis